MNNKDYLSQEEIDALLRQSSDDSSSDPASEFSAGAGAAASAEPDVNDYLSPMEQDALGEIGNITFGSAATALSTLLGKKVDITTPKVSAISKHTLESEFPKPHVSVHVNYVDGFQGTNLLVIKTIDAKVIADLMLGGDGTNTEAELNEIHISAVQEAMNQMMGSSATSMSTLFNRFVNISPPGIDILDMTQDDGGKNIPEEDIFIKVSFRIKIGDLIDSTLMQLLPVQFARDMISILLGGDMSEPPASKVEQNTVSMRDLEQSAMQAPPKPAYQEPAPSAPMQHPAAPQAPSMQPPPMQPPGYQQPYYPEQQQGYDPAAYAQPQPGMGYPPNPYGMPPQPPYMQNPYPQPTYAPQGFANRNVNIQPVQYSNFAPPQMLGDQSNLNMLLDIPLKVTVELGRTQRMIKDILELSQGSIVELDKLAGEPVDILVNNKLIAKGEVVVIDENFGVRVTDIISQMDRIQKLQ